MANRRAEPLREGDDTIFVVPLAVLLRIAVSPVPCHVLRACTPSKTKASGGTRLVGSGTTMMADEDSHTAPPLPHDLTYTVCAPVMDATRVSIDAPLTVVQLALLSME